MMIQYMYSNSLNYGYLLKCLKCLSQYCPMVIQLKQCCVCKMKEQLVKKLDACNICENVCKKQINEVV